MQLLTISRVTSNDDLDPKCPEHFAELVRRHHRDLTVYAQALTRETHSARDLVQDAFVVAYDKVQTFDVTRDFATWMRGIVRNKWREWSRKNSRYEFSDDNLAQIDADLAAWQSRQDGQSSPLFEALEVCLETLPDHLRDAVQACYYEGRTGDEASLTLGIAPAAVRKRLQRARNLLKVCLDRKLDSPAST
ncbi:MAG: RNA polymerase sigma factor [Verrucomicrobiota bacterium]